MNLSLFDGDEATEVEAVKEVATTSPPKSKTPERLQSIDTKGLRAQLAGLQDPQAAKPEFYAEQAKVLAVNFCKCLPAVFGKELDRMSMWDKIGAAITSGYAKTAGGDIDLFVNHVLQSIQASHSRVAACTALEDAINDMNMLPANERQDWLHYVVTHLSPLLVLARREYKEAVANREQFSNQDEN